ncbi:unnamed protein product, partial [Prorocentrum cordatum]
RGRGARRRAFPLPRSAEVGAGRWGRLRLFLDTAEDRRSGRTTCPWASSMSKETPSLALQAKGESAPLFCGSVVVKLPLTRDGMRAAAQLRRRHTQESVFSASPGSVCKSTAGFRSGMSLYRRKIQK